MPEREPYGRSTCEGERLNQAMFMGHYSQGSEQRKKCESRVERSGLDWIPFFTIFEPGVLHLCSETQDPPSFVIGVGQALLHSCQFPFFSDVHSLAILSICIG